MTLVVLGDPFQRPDICPDNSACFRHDELHSGLVFLTPEWNSGNTTLREAGAIVTGIVFQRLKLSFETMQGTDGS